MAPILQVNIIDLTAALNAGNYVPDVNSDSPELLKQNHINTDNFNICLPFCYYHSCQAFLSQLLYNGLSSGVEANTLNITLIKPEYSCPFSSALPYSTLYKLNPSFTYDTILVKENTSLLFPYKVPVKDVDDKFKMIVVDSAALMEVLDNPGLMKIDEIVFEKF